MKTALRVTTLILLLAPLSVFAASGGGGYGGDRLESSAPRKSPEDIAASEYNDGLEYRDKAWEYEQESKLSEDEKKKDKLLKKALKSYRKAADRFEKAVKHNPQLYQAWSALGHALKKTGEYDESLAAYKKALSINPDYHEAIEYQAEAHMAVHRFAEVKKAYARLVKEHTEYAGKLMQAIHEWLPKQDVSGNAELQAFSEWAKQQGT